jgi:hypothetical protein
MISSIFFASFVCAVTYKILIEVFLYNFKNLYPREWEQFEMANIRNTSLGKSRSRVHYFWTGEYRKLDDIKIKRIAFAANIIGSIGLGLFFIFIVCQIYILSQGITDIHS